MSRTLIIHKQKRKDKVNNCEGTEQFGSSSLSFLVPEHGTIKMSRFVLGGSLVAVCFLEKSLTVPASLCQFLWLLAGTSGAFQWALTPCACSHGVGRVFHGWVCRGPSKSILRVVIRWSLGQRVGAQFGAQLDGKPSLSICIQSIGQSRTRPRKQYSIFLNRIRQL